MQQRTVKYKAPQTGPMVSGAHLLLVDDDVTDIEYHYDVLQSQGHKVLAISSSYELGATLIERGDFDLVLVGQGSAAFEGRVVVERATSAGCDIPVVVLASHGNMRCYLEAMKLGAVDYVEKPLSAAEMRRVVAACLSSRIADTRGDRTVGRREMP